MVRQRGVAATLSRLLGSRIIGHWQRRNEVRQLDRLFDGPHLRDWWRRSGIQPVEATCLDATDTRAVIARLQPEIIVRVSGGILKRDTFSRARIVTLNIHHGIAPRIRGIWSIPWGIIEGRADWIGATVHEIDDGIDTGKVVWRGSPQLAHGDSAVTLFFRAHLEAVDALIRVIREYAGGMPPAAVPCEKEPSVYRSAPGIWTWVRYLYLRGGRRAPMLVERALR
jgi:methionyl-tRNA formyltransferase